MPKLEFDRDDAQAAAEQWGFNCGPAALAAILGKRPDDVREACQTAGFKKYLSPTMMKVAIRAAGGAIRLQRRCVKDAGHSNFPDRGLARIQWTGPWTATGMNPKWAWTHTHWVATWRAPVDGRDGSTNLSVFDINGGVRGVVEWVDKIVPLIVAEIKRADGGWYVANSWEVE